MNVELVGRLRPIVSDDRLSSDGSTALSTGNLDADASHQRIVNKLAGNSFTFMQLHNSAASNADVYRLSVEPLLQLFIGGYNTSLIVTGSKGSGKSFTVAGTSATNAGILPYVLQQLFSKIGLDGDVDPESRRLHNSTTHTGSLPQVQMQAFNITNETVVDLLVAHSSDRRQTRKPEITESAEKGTHVANLMSAQVTSDMSGQTLFRQAWARRNPLGATFIQLELAMVVAKKQTSTKSLFTILVLPMNSNPQTSANAVPAGTQLRKVSSSSSADSSKVQVALGQLVASLASQPYPDRVIKYSESKLTRLLQDQLGGNCRTRVIMCFSPFCDPSVTSNLFQLADSLSKVKNFPVINDSFAQQLHTQYRAAILGLQRQLDPSIVGLHSSIDYEQANSIQAENVLLRDACERLQGKLNELQDRYGALALSKTDLSTQLLMTEEDKLKVSKAVVDMQIENNRLKEENDESMFEMTNKVMQLEIKRAEAEEEKMRLAAEVMNAKNKAEEAEKTRREMMNEYVHLKSKNAELRAAHQKQVERNDNLSIEMLKVLNSHLLATQNSELAARERDRIRDIISHLTDRPAESQKLDEENDSADKPVFDAMNKLQQHMNLEVNEFEREKEKLRAEIDDLRTKLNDSRRLTRETQSKMAGLTAQLITALNDKEALQSQVNRIQHKLKDVNDDFRLRLVTYVKDIAAYLDTVQRRASDDGSTPAKMQQYVDDMLRNMKHSHRVREEQLGKAANFFQQRFEQTVRRHEELLVAYRILRQQVEAHGLTDVELGPDEHKMRLHMEPELMSSQQREIERLRDDLIQKQAELKALKLRERVGQRGTEQLPDNTSRKIPAERRESSTELQKKMNEFMLSSHKELQKKFDRVNCNNVMLKEEVKVLNEYIDTHLDRYGRETMKLRELNQQLRRAANLMSGSWQSPPNMSHDFGKSSLRNSRRN